MSANPSLKVILIEPAAVRRLTPPQASSLSELARSRSVTLLLPVRSTSLWTASIEETLLGLEILHDVHDDEAEMAPPAEATTNGDPDVSVEKCFDVSMSHIPTGLSSDALDKVAEVEAVKTQVGQLKRELEGRDRRIAELSRLVEEGRRKIEQQQEQQQQRGAVAEVESGMATAVVEPRTPVRSAGGAAAVQSRMLEDGVVATPSAVDGTPATQTAATSSPALPVASSSSTSRHLTAAVSSPSAATTSTAALTTLAPPAPITSPSPPVSPNSRSSTVIASLTTQLSETQALLDATRSALASARTLAASHQAAADEMRSTLTRIRLEADSSVSILSRKDRQISEALERARKAEGDARELGRASREWGTRIREVEEELGKERMRRARAEHMHELVAGEWKTARTRLVDEVKVLKEEHKAAVDGLSGEYQKVLVFKDRLKAESELLTSDGGEGVVAPSQLVKQLSALHAQMEAWITAQLAPLSKRLAEFERRENAEVMDKLKLLTDELTRIKTLMRRGDVVRKEDVPDGPF